MFSIYSLFEANTRLHAQHTALVFNGQRRTYEELGMRVNAFCHSLTKLGVKSGDRIGFMFRNSFNFVEIFYALQKLGAVAIPFCFAFREKELIHNINNSACSCFIYDKAYIGLIDSIKSSISTVKHYIHNGCEHKAGEYSLDRLFEEGDPSFTCVRNVSQDDEAMFLFTSGTTGLSKCVVHTQQGLLLFVVLPIVSDGTFLQSDTMLYYAPLYHLAGITYIMYLMSVGGTLVITDGFNPPEILDLLQKERVTQTFLIPPSFISRLEVCPDYEKADLSGLRYVIMSGGVNSPQYARKVFDKMPDVKICNTYGHSERAANTILYLGREEFERRPELVNSVGTVTQFGQLKLMDENGNESDFGEAYAKCPGMLQGYLNMESPFKDGWFPTGDYLLRDNEGYYWFKDRKKSMVKTGGENVFTPEVENVIVRHPSVLMCAVVGLPDPIFSEAVSVAVVLKPGCTMTKDEVRDFCGEHLSSFKKPRNVFFVDSLPISATGKVQKPILVEQLMQLL